MAKKVTKKTKGKTVKKKAGRPPTFSQTQKETMLRLAPLGYTNEEMANIIGCHKATFYRWLEADEVLRDSLKAAKEIADSMVIDSLFKKATGQVTITEKISGVCPNTGNIIETTKVKEVAPDTTSMIFWLKNRRPDQWREKQEVEHKVSEIRIDDEDKDL